MKKQLEILQPDAARVRDIQRHFKCHPVTARILANRGLFTQSEIEAFLNPSVSRLRAFATLKDMDTAVARIVRAIFDQEKILIFGDYDVDGITSTTLLYEFLTQAGACADYYIPDRVEEGYGLNCCQIQDKAIKETYSLVITLDCGSSSHEAVNLAAQNKVDVIVTDHHAISEDMPRAVAVVNPRRKDCDSGAAYLAGVGVAFCLVVSLRRRLRELNFWVGKKEPNLKTFCDLVALGTIADVVPLIRENRIMTSAGLNLIATRPRPGIAALIQASGANGAALDADDIAFKLCPRINAAGRLEHARMGVALLTATDPDQALRIAGELNKLNSRRQEIEQKIFREILLFLNDTPETLKNTATLVMGKNNWHEGVLGIAASRLAEKFFRPVILVSFSGDTGKGSGRSIPGINLHDALIQCAHLLEGFGGHPMAAGLRIKKSNFAAFKTQFEKTVAAMMPDHPVFPELKIDSRVDFDMISPVLMDEITTLAPFGPENPEPLFQACKVNVKFSRIIGKNHRRMTLCQGRANSESTLNAIWFNADADGAHNLDRTFFESLIFKLKWNQWNGKKTIQAIISYVE